MLSFKERENTNLSIKIHKSSNNLRRKDQSNDENRKLDLHRKWPQNQNEIIKTSNKLILNDFLLDYFSNHFNNSPSS
jgi:hypothetical protein